MAGVDRSPQVFQTVCNLRGEAVPADLYRRGGRLIPRIPSTADLDTTHSDDAHLFEVLSRGLNPVERRTWWRILDGWSIAAIADADDLTRAAIYARVRRMVSKNVWVARWWDARQTLQSS